ncbi:MAG: PhzF family phenazine biosynthesis protein [Acidimicrobiales bacterium]
MRSFAQVDVFTAEPYLGNPVAVVLDADGIDDDAMARFARWTNLSETTFVLAPTDPAADYRVRIFTPGNELPFAGHPTIGTCHAWLEAGGQPRDDTAIVQECGIGLVTLRRDGGRLAFAAPPLLRSGPVDEADLLPAYRVLGIERDQVVDAQWADNGPGWLAVRLESADAVLALEPDFGAADSYDIGVVGPYPLGVVGLRKVGVVGLHPTDAADPAAETPGPPADTALTVAAPPADAPAIEVRAFFRAGTVAAEDPVTGSLNAAIAQWLLADGTLSAPYVAAQGSALGRDGRVHISIADGEVWIGGDATTCITGTVTIA